jgi:hypothetical protein
MAMQWTALKLPVATVGSWPEPASLNGSCTAARAEGQLTGAELASANGPNRPIAVRHGFLVE